MSLSIEGFAKVQQWLLDEGFCRDEVAPLSRSRQ